MNKQVHKMFLLNNIKFHLTLFNREPGTDWKNGGKAGKCGNYYAWM